MRASTKLNRGKLLFLGSCVALDAFPPSRLVPLEPLSSNLSGAVSSLDPWVISSAWGWTGF